MPTFSTLICQNISRISIGRNSTNTMEDLPCMPHCWGSSSPFLSSDDDVDCIVHVPLLLNKMYSQSKEYFLKKQNKQIIILTKLHKPELLAKKEIQLSKDS